MPPKSNKQSLSSEKKCVFCNISEDNELKYGKIYEHDGIITHYYCLLLSSNMQQRGRDEDGILGFLAVDIQKELKRGRRLFCSFCKKIGATLGCCNRKCKTVFHLPCGMKNNTLHQFYGQYKSFCVTHRPKQHIDDQSRVEAPEKPMCYICYDDVNRDNIYQTLWAPCCKKNAWFHRDCVQQLALSAGYFFKCPLCNNKKEFQKAMLESGIFVPSQDASWELVPNAFHELLYRHNKCDATKCLCPYGREHVSANARWELVLCRTCGSQGVHMGCSNLKWINPVWECDECSSILNKSVAYANSNSSESINGDENTPILNDESKQDDAMSDSDISVGVESSEINETNEIDGINELDKLNQPIVLRPGPRSSKLKQLAIQKAMKESNIEHLTSILNNQQAHNSISDEIPTPDPVEKILPTNVELKEPENSTSTELPPKTIEDVILIDSDDDNEVVKLDSPTPYMNIKISEVTSLPPEVFARVPDVSSISETVHETSQLIPSPYLMKRKADSSDVVSMIVKRINDSIDSPDVTIKRLRLDDDNFNTTVNASKSSLESHSVLRGTPLPRNINSYRNGVSLAQAAIVKVNGREFVLPLENSPSPTTSSSATIIPIQPNSDGDAGTKCAEFTYQFADNGARKDSGADADECPRRRHCDDHGIRENTKVKQYNDDACTSRATDSRINRNRLMRKKVLLRDLKFRIHSNDTITMTYRDELTMNIAVEAKRERKTVNNCSFFCIKNNSRWTSRARGSDLQQCYNKTSDSLSHCVKNNDSVTSTKCDRASDVEDTCVLSKDSTHFLVNGGVNNLCEYQRKEAAKENLVPDMYEQSNNINPDKLTNSERINSRRFRYENKNNNENNSVTSRKYTNTMSVTSDPGTSRDELRELSHSNINRRHLATASNLIGKCNRKLTNYRRKSLSSYFNRENIRCRVSIDLNRIKSIFDKIPKLMMEKRNSIAYRSVDDLKIFPTSNTNENNFFGSLRRCKSENNILSMYNNNSSKTINNYFLGINLFDLQKRKKGRRRKRMDKHDCVRSDQEFITYI